MKNIVLLILLVFLIVPINAQNIEDEIYNSESETYKKPEKTSDEIKTILGHAKSNGGYGAFSVRYNEIDSEDGLCIGFRGAWIMNHSFALGVAGYGFFNEAHPNELIDQEYDYNIGGGYGGFYFEPIIFALLPVHLSFPVFFGIGGVEYSRDYFNSEWDWDDYDYSYDTDAFLVVKPGVELELNMLKHFRLGIGVYYRYTSEINLENDFGEAIVDKDVLRGLSMGVIFKFGKF